MSDIIQEDQIPTIYSKLTEIDMLETIEDDQVIEEIYNLMTEVSSEKLLRDQAKSDIEELLKRLQRYQNLQADYEKHRVKVNDAKDKLEKLVQKHIQGNPEIEPSEVKVNFNGISFRATREWEFVDGISTAKGKRILYDWLMENGVMDGDYLYLNIDGKLVKTPFRPVKRIATTLPTGYK